METYNTFYLIRERHGICIHYYIINYVCSIMDYTILCSNNCANSFINFGK